LAPRFSQRFLSLHAALGRLRGRLLKKQLDRCRQVDHVVHQLHTMLRRNGHRSADSIADALDSYLSDRYDTKDFHLVVWEGSRTSLSFGSGFYVATTLLRLHAAVYFGDRSSQQLQISSATTYTGDDLQMAALGRPHDEHMKQFANDVNTHGNYLHWVRQSVESQHKHVTSYVYCSAELEQRGKVEPSGYTVADGTVNMEVLPSVKVAEPADNMALINGYGLALSVSSGGWTNSNWLEQRPCAGTDDQVWSLIVDRLRNLRGFCLSPSLSAAHSYTYVMQLDCNWQVDHQEWRREGDRQMALVEGLFTPTKGCTDFKSSNKSLDFLVIF
jgi:hypothetical protein